MATRPSGLRQPSAVRSSNTNLASSSGSGIDATPAAKPGNSAMSRLPSSNSIRRKITTPGIQAPGSRDSGLAPDVDHFIIGDTVYVNGDPTKRGKICFLGEVSFAKGDFAGIVLDLPIGNHDGVVQGKRYFQCAPSHGLFTKLSRLTRDPILGSPSTPLAPQSTASSIIMSPDPPISGASAVERTPSPSGQRTPAKSSSPAINSSLSLGERVIVASATGGTKIGILRYLGTTEFAAGEWAGVELLTPMGKNNGVVGGKAYFSCKDKHGLFVPASKVISSPVNKTPRRHGSRESLISVSSLASSAASRSIRRPSVRDSQCLPTCSLQNVLAEKEKHVERLIKERELDRVDLANLSRQFEEKKLEIKKLQSECAFYQQQLQTSSGDSEEVTKLQNALEEEHRKLEDLQYTLDEEKIMKTDLQAQLDSLTAKLAESEEKSLKHSLNESEEYKKELESLKAVLNQKDEENKKAVDGISEHQAKLKSHEKIIEDLNQKVNTLNDEITKAKEERQLLVTAHKEEVAALKKTEADQADSISKLKLQLDDKKRREEEYKERQQKLLSEFENVQKQKCSLESEIIDLVNSKSDTSELLSSKIKDLNDEIQDLRAKLQSTEEDKAVLRRINAEFKSRLAQQEQAESNLKKTLEESLSKKNEEHDAASKVNIEEISALKANNQKLEEDLQKRGQEIIELKRAVVTAEENLKTATGSSQEAVQVIASVKNENAELSRKLGETLELLKKEEENKKVLIETVEKKEATLNEKNKELSLANEKISQQLSSSVEESCSLKKEVEALKSEIGESKKANEDISLRAKSLAEEVSQWKKNSEESNSTLEDLANKIEALKKDKSNLKEQIASYKTDSNRFQEIEQALSQEVAVLRNKLEQKNKAIYDLEKEISEKKADLETSKASKLDVNSPQAHIDFLNSIIVDLQRKNEELNVKLNVLINGGGDADANSNRVAPGGSKTFQSLRPYCDICEKFDLHDTEDCPAQVTEDNTHYGSVRGESRPYCETCEIFGHVTGECDDQETY